MILFASQPPKKIIIVIKLISRLSFQFIKIILTLNPGSPPGLVFDFGTKFSIAPYWVPKLWEFDCGVVDP